MIYDDPNAYGYSNIIFPKDKNVYYGYEDV